MLRKATRSATEPPNKNTRHLPHQLQTQHNPNLSIIPTNLDPIQRLDRNRRILAHAVAGRQRGLILLSPRIMSQLAHFRPAGGRLIHFSISHADR